MNNLISGSTPMIVEMPVIGPLAIGLLVCMIVFIIITVIKN